VGSSDVGYADSILWKRRVELFKALGEPDARNWQPIGAGTRWDTKSQKLHNCLAVLHSPWKAPIWASVLFIWDPRVDAIYQSGEVARRLTRPVLLKIFTSKAEAQAAATEELGGEGVTVTVKSQAAHPGEPPLPGGYEEFHDAWVETVQGLKNTHGDKMPPPPVVAEDLKTLLVSYADLQAWWDKV